MQDVNTCDYREDMQGGIRSLNCSYFNHLRELSTRGDHPAALLFGCRSGIQYQILSGDGEKHRIVGMVAVYFPFYHFWENFSVSGEGSLVNEADPDKTDDAYHRYWTDGFNTIDETDNKLYLAKCLAAPLCKDEECKDIVDHLTCMSSLWPKIPAHVLTKGVPQNVREVLQDLATGPFDPEKVLELTQWFERECAVHTLSPSRLKPEEGRRV